MVRQISQKLEAGRVPLHAIVLFLCSTIAANAQALDLRNAVFLISPSIERDKTATISEILTEEIGRRTSSAVTISNTLPEGRTLIGIVFTSDDALHGKKIPKRQKTDETSEYMSEGYRIVAGDNTVWLIGADTRGIMYAIGKLLRTAVMTEDAFHIHAPMDISEHPEFPMRGHQIGYRNTANSWDAWTVEQYDQYIRELVLFGANAVENIPIRGNTPAVHMKMMPREMHLKISEICDKYDAQHWIWTPATFDLSDDGARAEEVKKHRQFYKECVRLDGVFVPGGDPGDNHPRYVLPFLQELHAELKKYHPEAGVWFSMQGFDEEMVTYVFEYLHTESPDWLAGIVNGPSSPPVHFERYNLPEKYQIRAYSDITHTIRCQYPVDGWDQAFALTLGREPTNPQPVHYKHIFNQESSFVDGFVCYSDGVHDDVNKVVYNQLGWNADADMRDVLIEYCRFFFGSDAAIEAAEGILALEKNWVGPLRDNGAVEATLSYWQGLETKHPQLAGNWRWQQLVMRAYYDAYVRRRLIYEHKLEAEAYAMLDSAHILGANRAMEKALVHLNLAVTAPVAQEIKEKVLVYCDRLFSSIALQTSVPKFQASGYERGAILDFIDYPLNNRWWLEDEFDKVRNMNGEEAKISRLQTIRNWENPGPGGHYDDVSNIAKSPHVISSTDDAIDFAWWDDGFSRRRLSTQVFQFSPVLEYSMLDPNADYLIRIAGYGEALLRANGERLQPITYEKELETFKEFVLPGSLIPEGNLRITFDRPDESHLNWRQYSKVMEVWLIKE
jgi:hypothetical protein